MEEKSVEHKPDATAAPEQTTAEEEKSKPFEIKRYFAFNLDPVHVGTGGYRLGRVDNTIVREPGTNIPKIPGSSIAGVTRAYTAMAVQGDTEIVIGDDKCVDAKAYKKCKYLRPAYKFTEESIHTGRRMIIFSKENKPLYEGEKPEVEKYFSCAGKGAEDGEGHCGEADCEVCATFGFSKKNSSFQGLAQFHDARILFFPVYTMKGPVWITCPGILACFSMDCSVAPEGFKPANTTTLATGGRLNFGWLLLEQDGTDTFTIDSSKLSQTHTLTDAYKVIFENAFIVSDRIFSQIVNDNLEVRTSVAIDPCTGAAEDGALFTYEAIPRAALLWFEVVYTDPRYFRIEDKQLIIDKVSRKPAGIGWLKKNVETGLRLFELLGIGGMNTRGMGRMRVLL